MLTADITNTNDFEAIKVLLEIAKIYGFTSAKISPNHKLLDMIFNYAKTMDISVYAVCDNLETIDKIAQYTDTCEIQDTNLLRYARDKFKNIIVNVNGLNVETVEDIYFTYGPQCFVVESDRLSLIKRLRNIGSVKICYKNESNEILHHLALAFNVDGLEKVINLKNANTIPSYVGRIDYTRKSLG